MARFNEPHQGFAAWPLGLTGTRFAAVAVVGGKAGSHYQPHGRPRRPLNNYGSTT